MKKSVYASIVVYLVIIVALCNVYDSSVKPQIPAIKQTIMYGLEQRFTVSEDRK